MLRESLNKLSTLYWNIISIVATVGTAVMVYVFFANQLGVSKTTSWQILALVLPTILIIGFVYTLIKIENSRDLPYDIGLYVLVGNAFLSAEESAQDDTHRIDTTEQKIDLTDNAQNVVITEYYTGRNVRSQESEYFKFYFDSETFIEGNSVSVKQILENGREVELEIEKLRREGEFVGVYKADFYKPLQKNDQFELKITSQLDSWDLSDGQYIYWDFNRFQHGVGEAKCTVSVDNKPETIAGYNAIDHTETVHHNDPKKLDFDIHPIELTENKGGQEISVDGEELRDTIYVIKLEW